MRIRFTKMTFGATAMAAAAVTAAGLSLGPAQAALAAPKLRIPIPCNSAALASAVAGVPSGSTLLLSPGCTYILTKALPDINKALTFVGPATLARSGAEETPDFTIMTVDADGHVVLQGISFLGGFTGDEEDDSGGAIYNDEGSVFVNGGLFSYNIAFNEGGAIDNAGFLHVTGATFIHNHAKYGGAIYNDGTASVTLSHFTDNSVLDDGGAIENDDSMHVDLSTFSQNSATYGGGFYVDDNDTTITNSQFTDNGAEYGGGVYSYYGSTLTGDTFDANGGKGCYEGGAVYNDDTTTLAGSTLEENTCVFGAGLYNASDATVDHVLFQTNSAGTDGGGIYNDEDLTLTNSRMHNNYASDDGAGIDNEDSATIAGTTINLNTAGNTGGGIYNDDTVSLSKSSVVQNKPDNCAPFGSVTGCFG